MCVNDPGQVVMGHNISSLLENRTAAEGAQDLVGVTIRNFILEFLPGVPCPWALDGQPSPARLETNTDLPSLKAGDQPIAQAAAADCVVLPAIVRDQKFALNFDRHSTTFCSKL
jgi:hypothetical protein